MALAAYLSPNKIKIFFHLILITALAYLLSSLFLFYLELNIAGYLPPESEEIDLPEVQHKNIRDLQEYKIIVSRNLFNVKADEVKEEKPKPLRDQIDELSLTSLNFTLIGTIIRESGGSWAIIQDNQSKKADKYRVGDKIGVAKVAMILRNKVVLNIDGKDELLVMGIEKIRAENKKSGATDKSASTDGVKSYQVSRSFIDQSINNIPQIMANVRVKPYIKDGKPSGFQVTRIKSGSMFKTMGFVDGDVINSVNGEKIRSAEDIMRLYNTLKGSNYFSVGVIRKNRQQTLSFRVR